MQLLFEKSHEYGEHAGLGLLPGERRPAREPVLAPAGSYKVPHIGWNSLHLATARKTRCSPACARAISSTMSIRSTSTGCGEALAAGAEYGGVTVAGAVGAAACDGTQFHPEKSGAVGLRILRAFAAL
ncbi:MAG: hypothetical protein V8T36_02935 [Ruthenibacterium lactatiformans]